MQTQMRQRGRSQSAWTPVEEPGDDAALIRQGLDGNRTALEILFARHAHAGYQGALKLLGNVEDAEDALQEGLLAAYKNLRHFEGRSQFSTWLTRIVINAALMRRRSLRAHDVASLDEPLGEMELTLSDQLASSAPNPEQDAAQGELRRLLDRHLRRLSPVLRSAYELREIEELSTEEAAEAAGAPENTLKSRVRRARMELKERVRRSFRSDGGRPTASASGRPLALATP